MIAANVLISSRNIELPSVTSYYRFPFELFRCTRKQRHSIYIYTRSYEFYILANASGEKSEFTIEKRAVSCLDFASKLPQSRFRVVFSFSRRCAVSLPWSPKTNRLIDRGDERLSVFGARRSIPQCSGRNASFVARRFMARSSSCAERARKFPKASVGRFDTKAVDDRTGVDGGGIANCSPISRSRD